MSPASRAILGVRVHAVDYDEAVQRIVERAERGQSMSVCATSVHGVMEARDDPDFRRVLNEADLITPDGMPLVWGLRLLGLRGASRVYGPVLMPRLCAEAARRGIPVGFYGGTPEVLTRLRENLGAHFPGLRIAYDWSPPFRPLDAVERARVIDDVRRSGARIVFVGLGCPKQERWIAEHRDEWGAVLVGVGAAFDFLAGVKPQAPGWVQRSGFEWLFRLVSEPRRLAGRYARIVPRFTWAFTRQLVRGIR